MPRNIPDHVDTSEHAPVVQAGADVQVAGSLRELASLPGGEGPAMRLLQSGFRVEALRPLAGIHNQGLLRRDDWIHYDNVVIDVARDRLIGIQDLRARGLTMPLPNALGRTRVEWERMSDMDPAEIDMAAVTPGRNDRVEFDMLGLPIPIIHKDFWINIRALEASRNGGTPLDSTQVAVATRKVAEKMESILFSGSGEVGANTPIYGYTNAPQRNTGSVTANWSTAATGEEMLADVIEMIGLAKADNMFGPYVLYVNTLSAIRMSADFKTNSDKSILSRLMEIPDLSDIRSTNYLTGTNILLVQMTSDVVDLIDGFMPTVVQWESHGGFVFNFKVMAIQVPRVKYDYANQSGIVHYS